MSNKLSLYASRVLAENPLGLWSLDDQADFVSLLQDGLNDLSSWIKDDTTDISLASVLDVPMPESKVYSINKAANITGSLANTRVSSAIVGNLKNLDAHLGTLSIGTFIYSVTDTITSIKIGFSYLDPTYGEYDVFKVIPISISKKWLFLSQTFDIPKDMDADYRLFIEFEYLVDPQNSPGNFLINGISLGQWSEEFNSTSTGVIPETISQKIYGIPDDQKCVKVLGAAESTVDGYILVNGADILAKNFGIPLVYGSQSSTSLYVNDYGDTQRPSLIIPGLGFLNNSGKNKNYTLEFWLRLNSSASSRTKIMGPISSSDGLFAEGPFLKLVVDDVTLSYYVGEWYRPMLVHISISNNLLTLMINGEIVASSEILRDNLLLPLESIGGRSTDWLGFYGSTDFNPIEIDAISLYTYNISQVIAKRRWVYGQAVQSPDVLNSAYGGKTIAIDYNFSNYSNSFSFPKNSSWSKGNNNNFDTNLNALSMPNYVLPEIKSTNSSEKQILTNMHSLQNEDKAFIRLPENSFLFYKDISPLQGDISAFYGIFKTLAPAESSETLFLISDNSNGDKLHIKNTSDGIVYSLTYSGIEEQIVTTATFISGEEFAVGISLKALQDSFGTKVKQFLIKQNSLSMSIGGTGNGDTFSGNIYGISFINAASYSSVSDFFAPNGLVWGSEVITYAEGEIDAGYYNTSFWQFIFDGGSPATYANVGLLNNTKTNYFLKPYANTNSMYLGIDAHSTWNDSVPLSYFAKYIKKNAISEYDLDFIQFNVDYPSPSKLVKNLEQGSWTYAQLSSRFAQPSQKVYADLENPLYTGYIDYEDLKNNSRYTYKYDTSNSILKTYIYFKEHGSFIEDPVTRYTNISQLNSNGIIEPGEEWINTKYEIIDSTIIYPPKNIDFNKVSIFVEIEANVQDVKTSPIAIKNLSLTGVSLNNYEPTFIGSRFGQSLSPYTKNGFYFDFKARNPFTIYKGSTPHLYLTKTSGIELRGDFDPFVGRGIEIPLNKELASNYQIIAANMFLKFDGDFFPYAPVEIFEIQSHSSHLKFFMEAIDPNGKRAKIYSVNMKTGQLENGIGFYVNGKIAKDGILSVKKWTVLGISFSSYIDVSVYGGAFRLTGPVMINNFSYYNSAKLQQVQAISARPWFKVKESGRLRYDWRYWDGLFKWFEVLVFAATSFYGVNPSDIYNAYVGTSKLSVSDGTILRFARYKFRAVSNSVSRLLNTTSV